MGYFMYFPECSEDGESGSVRVYTIHHQVVGVKSTGKNKTTISSKYFWKKNNICIEQNEVFVLTY
jgi:hypothetical protein